MLYKFIIMSWYNKRIKIRIQIFSISFFGDCISCLVSFTILAVVFLSLLGALQEQSPETGSAVIGRLPYLSWTGCTYSFRNLWSSAAIGWSPFQRACRSSSVGSGSGISILRKIMIRRDISRCTTSLTDNENTGGKGSCCG